MTTQIELVNGVLEKYLTSMVNKDTTLIEEIFASTAQMYLIKDRQLVQLPVFPGLIQFMQQAPDDSGKQTKFLSSDITDNAASGKVEVISQGLVYTDYFNLLQIDNNWKIVNKTFSVTKQKTKFYPFK
jgi:hypothetical protein